MLLNSLTIYCHSNGLLINYCIRLLTCCHYKLSSSLRGERLILKNDTAIYLSAFEIVVPLEKGVIACAKINQKFKVKYEVLFSRKLTSKIGY